MRDVEILGHLFEELPNTESYELSKLWRYRCPLSILDRVFSEIVTGLDRIVEESE